MQLIHLPIKTCAVYPWWRHKMETFSALLDFCTGNSPVTGEFPAQRPVTWTFDVFFDLGLNKRFSKQSRCCWFEAPSRSSWRHYNAVQDPVGQGCTNAWLQGGISLRWIINRLNSSWWHHKWCLATHHVPSNTLTPKQIVPHLQLHFSAWKCDNLIIISFKFVSVGPIDNTSAIVKVVS